MDQYLNLPVPASIGAGAAVDVSKMGATKTIVVGGVSGGGSVVIEYATDDTGTIWAEMPNGVFTAPGRTTLQFAARWMRARNNGASGNADVGAASTGASFLLLPAGGAQVDISTMRSSLKTAVAPGACNVEVSEDGVSWSQVFSFQQRGGQTGIVIGRYARVTGGGPVWLGSASLAEGLGDTLTALAFFNADGTFVKQCGFVPGSAQHLGVGTYQVQLESPPPNMFTDICFAVTRGGTTDGSEVATVVNPDIIQVRTFDAAGALADSLFCLKVWDISDCGI